MGNAGNVGIVGTTVPLLLVYSLAVSIKMYNLYYKDTASPPHLPLCPPFTQVFRKWKNKHVQPFRRNETKTISIPPVIEMTGTDKKAFLAIEQSLSQILLS